MKKSLIFIISLVLGAGASFVVFHAQTLNAQDRRALDPAHGQGVSLEGTSAVNRDPHGGCQCPPVTDDAISRLGEFLMKKKAALKKREAALEAREDSLNALKTEINQRVAELNSLIRYSTLLKQAASKKELAREKEQEARSAAGPGISSEPDGREDEKVISIIKNLPPKAAGKVLAGVPPMRAARILYSLTPDQAAQIMQKMPADRAAKVTQFMGTVQPQEKTAAEKLPELKPLTKKISDAKAVPRRAEPKRRSRRRRRRRSRRSKKSPFMPVKRVK